MKLRAPAALLVLLLAGGYGYWYYRQTQSASPSAPVERIDGDWLAHLYSQNPKVAAEAARQLEELGVQALPEIRTTLQDPGAGAARRKAAMKAAQLLGPVAAPAIPDIAAHLTDPALTDEAAVALSFLGRDAYAPLRQGATSGDPLVRRESLRSLGKLQQRAPLGSETVVPLLLHALADPDPGVRTVAATYLGIIGDDAADVVPALIETLEDETAEVRAAAATALGSFGKDAAPALPALRKAGADRDEDVAREAGLAIVKIQSSSRK